jgi:hypothetical protein
MVEREGVLQGCDAGGKRAECILYKRPATSVHERLHDLLTLLCRSSRQHPSTHPIKARLSDDFHERASFVFR